MGWAPDIHMERRRRTTGTTMRADRFKVIQAVNEARPKPGQAAERLGLSVRQVERLVLHYRAAGVTGPVLGSRYRRRGPSSKASAAFLRRQLRLDVLHAACASSLNADANPCVRARTPACFTASVRPPRGAGATTTLRREDAAYVFPRSRGRRARSSLRAAAGNRDARIAR